MSHAYDQIAKAILAQTDEAGRWKPCWHTTALTMPKNAVSGRLYQGVNVLSLWCAALSGGYCSPLWATYKQWQEKGAQVRKGESGTPIVYFGSASRENEDGNRAKYRFARSSWVFNAAQVEGFEIPGNASDVGPEERLQMADLFIAGTGAKVFHSPAYDPPHFDPGLDSVNMPPIKQFHSPEAYYSVMMHELTHWTGGKRRLERETLVNYSRHRPMEELTAELGAAFLCADLEISNEPRPDHAAYIASWQRSLTEQPDAFMKAVSAASQAAQYLHQLQVSDAKAA